MASQSHQYCRQPLSRGGGSIGLASAALVAGAAFSAACGDGGTEPEPPQPNRAPVAQSPIAAQTVPVGETVVLSVASAFSDPDGDGLTYAVTSSAPSVASVTVSGVNVTVTGVSAGTANVTLTASDPSGLSAQQAFQVTVPNRPPEVTDSIPDQTPQAGDTVSVNLAQHFSDPDGDDVAYEASSSDVAVASASVSGSVLTIAAVGSGTASVTVTASDPSGLSARQTLQVTVPSQPPEVTDSIPDQTLHAGDTVSVNLLQHFSDPDGDELTYEASSSAVAVASTSVSDGVLTIAAVGSGIANVTVTASDPTRLSAQQTLRVTVPNRPPVVTDSIPDQTPQSGDTVSVNLVQYFSDPDGDALTYEASSSDTAVASASVSGSVLTIAAVGSGTASISVTASDPGGLSASQDLGVTVAERGVCGRTPQIRDGIVEAIGTSGCESVTAADLAGIRSLFFVLGGLTSLRQGDFDGLTGLRSLVLANHELVSLPDGVFVGLKSLENLEVSHNKLASLQPNIFTGLSNLESLRLIDNQLVSLHEGVFSGLDRVTSLALTHNKLNSISASAFSGLNSLNFLDLQNNELTSLPESVFSDLTRLQLLHLHNNRLTSLPQGIFSGLDELGAIWLSNNQLESLPVGVFSGLHDLETVALEDNLLSSLPVGVFTDMSTQSLFLDGNRLASLPEGVFSGLTDLATLSLSTNQLDSLPSGVFSGLASLQGLILAENRLESLPEGIFSGLPGFEFLWLGNNPGAPFEFRLQFDRTDGPNGAASPDSVRLVLAEGAPFNLTVPLSAQNGTLSATSATLPAGSTSGPALIVTQGSAAQSTRVTATGTPPDLDQDPRFEGFTIGWPAELVLFSSGAVGDATGFGSASLTTRGLSSFSSTSLGRFSAPVQAPQELPTLVPVPSFIEKLRLQLDPHRHLTPAPLEARPWDDRDAPHRTDSDLRPDPGPSRRHAFTLTLLQGGWE